VTARARLSIGAGILLGAVMVTAAHPAHGRCHIHPPSNETRQGAPQTVGPFAGRTDCEAERMRRFGALGRCHCSAPFTPGWVTSEPRGAEVERDGPRRAETLLP
jgi:hypothetical protein